jgi:glycosyltransferase involved in cell wall biosynthesis
MPFPEISLIIPAYNEEEYIGLCLDSVLEHASDRLHEIIIVDNASTDCTVEIARQRSGVRVVHEERKGLSYARQRGLKEAGGELIAFIDADTRIPKHWISMVDNVFTHQPYVICLSGCYRYYDASAMKRVLLNALWWSTAPLAYFVVGYMVVGGNFIARKSTLQAIGGFDRTIEFYGEDTDVARRLSQYGVVLFKMNFFMYTSSRRFQTEGLFKTSVIYAINYIWMVIFHRPFSNMHHDVRAIPKCKISFIRIQTADQFRRIYRCFADIRGKFLDLV